MSEIDYSGRIPVVIQVAESINNPDGKCCHPYCDRIGRLGRSHTMYHNEFNNWNTLCDEHREKENEYYVELWDSIRG